MSRTPTFLPLMLIAALAACWPAASAASDEPAGGAPRGAAPRPSAVSKLSAEELAFLQKRIPNWDELDPRRKEAHAAGVIRLRNLSTEQRTKLLERIEKMRKHGSTQGPRDHRSRLQRVFIAKAVGQVAYAALPEDVKEEARRQKVDRRALAEVFFRRLWSKAAEEELAAFSAERLEALSPPERKSVEKLHAAAVAAPEDKKARARLGSRLLEIRGESIRRELDRTASAERGRSWQRLGVRVRETWPAAFDAVLQAIVKNPKKYIDEARRLGETMGRGLQGRGEMGWGKGKLKDLELVHLAFQLERARVHSFAEQPEMQRHVDAILRVLLAESLKIDSATVERGLASPDPEARQQLLVRIRAKVMGQAGGRRPGPGAVRPGDRRGPRPGDEGTGGG